MYFRMHLTHNHFGVAKGISFYKLSLKQESEAPAPLLRCSSIFHPAFLQKKNFYQI